MALLVCLDLVGELHLDGIELLSTRPATKPGWPGISEPSTALQADGAGHVEAGGGRAIEKARVERNRDRLAGGREGDAGLQLIVEPLGHIVFEQELRMADRRRVGVGESVDRPRARLRVGGERHRIGAAAEALIVDGWRACIRRRRGA